MLKNLVPETCTCVGQSCTSFFLYKFNARIRAQLCSGTETVRHVARIMQRDWPESWFGVRNCDELASYFSCKLIAQVSGTRFLSVCRQH